MSLVSFHRGLIALAILFCLGYGLWEITGVGRGGAPGSLGIGVVFLLLAGGLGYYLLRLNRFLGYEEEEEHEGPAR